MGCTEACWTPVACPTHGDQMNPLGRSAPMSDYVCCENYSRSEFNPRHLWSIHDSTRWYTDPEGWAQHEASCVECGPVSEGEAPISGRAQPILGFHRAGRGEQ